MASQAEGRKVHRSPAFPFVSLRRAVERAQQLYEKNRRHPAPLRVAAGVWGYGEKSSGGLQTVSALKQFGLLTDDGSGDNRHVKLTDLAYKILLDEVPSSAERMGALRQAARNPRLYGEMLDKWGTDLPTDETIRTYLRRDKNVNEEALTTLIRDFRDTLAYAGLASDDKLEAEHGDASQKLRDMVVSESKVQESQGVSAGRATASAVGTLVDVYEPARIALEGGGIGRVAFTTTAVTPDDIQALIDVLQIQKRQLERMRRAETGPKGGEE